MHGSYQTAISCWWLNVSVKYRSPSQQKINIGTSGSFFLVQSWFVGKPEITTFQSAFWGWNSQNHNSQHTFCWDKPRLTCGPDLLWVWDVPKPVYKGAPHFQTSPYIRLTCHEICNVCIFLCMYIYIYMWIIPWKIVDWYEFIWIQYNSNMFFFPQATTRPRDGTACQVLLSKLKLWKSFNQVKPL